MDQNYWDSFYDSNPDLIKPSQFARFIVNFINEKNLVMNIFDLGCGTARDTNFFLLNKINVLGIDLSSTVIKKNKAKLTKLNETFVDFYSTDFTCFDYENFNFKNSNISSYALYSRFTLHSLNYDQENFFLNTLSLTKNLKFLFIEARTIKDDIYGNGEKVGMHEYITSHYRRFIDPLVFLPKLKKIGFEIITFEEGHGFSKTANDDPHLMRVIAIKK